ncbi:MAG: hypothetical protein M3P51_08000, partial [Chloroflexota bacterium]|nr:hypothetical protein [Chloroflexota bacterium]
VYGDIIGGSNPTPLVKPITPMDDFGVMGGGPMGGFIPGGGYTDPADDFIGVGFGQGFGAYTPKDQGWTTPNPEGSGGTCGTGFGSSTPFPDCTIA